MRYGRAIAEAERFAQNAFVAEFEIISRQFQDKLAASRAQLAAKGVLGMVKETARINAERITALLQARLNSLLEGYDLYGVAIDEELTLRAIEDLIQLRTSWIGGTVKAYELDPVTQRLVASGSYKQMLEQHVAVSQASMRAQIDRRRLTVTRPRKR